MRATASAALLLALAVAAPLQVAGSAGAGFRTTVRLSVDRSSEQSGSPSTLPQVFGASAVQDRPAVSADGRFVAFTGTTDGVSSDVFVYDLLLDTTTRVSVAQGSEEPNGASWGPSISADGRYVAFVSEATNMVPDDTNALADVFVRDTTDGVTLLVSLTDGGGPADGPSSEPSVSADGARVAFVSTASNLADGDTSSDADVFLRDAVEASTRLLSTSTTPGLAGPSTSPSISGDGQYVAFEAVAANPGHETVSHIFRADAETGTVLRVTPIPASVPAQGSFAPSISADGRLVAFDSLAPLVPGDNNGFRDIYLVDMQEQATTVVSQPPGGGQADGFSADASISPDGSVVVFRSAARNLVAGANHGTVHVYTTDLATGTTSRLSVSSEGVSGDASSHVPATSAEGTTVVFTSEAGNLVSGDSNKALDLFASLGCPYDRGPVSGQLSPTSGLSHTVGCALSSGGL